LEVVLGWFKSYAVLEQPQHPIPAITAPHIMQDSPAAPAANGAPAINKLSAADVPARQQKPTQKSSVQTPVSFPGRHFFSSRQ